MMTNLFIIHSYNADTKISFGPYLEREAIKLGLNVIFPDFPIRQDADYKTWAKIMDKYRKDGYLNKDSIIIAHSLGTLFIPRYLAENNISINLFISCAGFVNYHSDREDLNSVTERFKPTNGQIDSAINLMRNRYAIYSNNDHIIPFKELENYANRYKAEKVYIENIGHLGKSSGITELPQAIEIIKSIIE